MSWLVAIASGQRGSLDKLERLAGMLDVNTINSIQFCLGCGSHGIVLVWLRPLIRNLI
jgi:hypothetical protein